jgi:hypothetical protein
VDYAYYVNIDFDGNLVFFVIISVVNKDFDITIIILNPTLISDNNFVLADTSLNITTYKRSFNINYESVVQASKLLARTLEDDSSKFRKTFIVLSELKVLGFILGGS